MIYGATSADTDEKQQRRVIGFLQIEALPIQDIERSSPAAIERKRANGWQDKWTYGLPVVRAWRVDEPILLEKIAHTNYRPTAGQAITIWSPPLTDDEVDLALKIRVKEVRVFGEPELSETASRPTTLENAYQPSRAFPGSFGKRTAEYGDGAGRNKKDALVRSTRAVRVPTHFFPVLGSKLAKNGIVVFNPQR